MLERISEALAPECVNLALQGRRKPDVIHELVEMLADCGHISDAATVEAAVLDREELTTTGIGGGIAIPHCLTSEVERTILGVGRAKRPVRFEAVDNKPVTLFFIMVGPEGAHNEHLRLLSKLARYLHDTTLKQELLRASTPEEIVGLLAAKEGS